MVYIHSDTERHLPHNFDAACALYGARENGHDTRLTTFDEVASGKFDTLIRKNVFAGSVDFMTEVFKRAGKEVAALGNPFQQSVTMPLSAARNKVTTDGPQFIKPVKTKLFTGMVFTTADLPQISKYADDTEVIVATPFADTIASEVRCYVHSNKIVDARNYAGDFRIAPDYNKAEALLQHLTHYPIAHTIDIGILANGQQVVIELNDMWAIGNYGIDNAQYFTLLHDRYHEIMASSK